MTDDSASDYLLTPEHESCASIQRELTVEDTQKDTKEEDYHGREKNSDQHDTSPAPENLSRKLNVKETEDASRYSLASTNDCLTSYEPISQHHITLYEPVLHGCRRVDVYHHFTKLSEGTYGEVYRAQSKETGEIVALKHIKYHAKMWDEGFPLTSLREISILLELNHPNIVSVREVVVGRNPNRVYMVMEYSEHELKTLLERNRPSFSLSERKRLLYQLISAVEHLHSHWVLHRDLKTSNLLYSNKGALKICDFGMARKFGDPIQPYTHNVVTLWYRAPELIFGQRKYDASVDMWSVGCVMGELLSRRPLFAGKNETDALDKIFRLCGTPTEESWPEYKQLPLFMNSCGLEFKKHVPTWRQLFPVPKSHLTDSAAISDCGLHLLQSLLCLNPAKRITAKDALAHPFFTEKPLPQREHLMPTAPDSHVKAAKRRNTPDGSGSGEDQKTIFGNMENSYMFGRRVDPDRYLTRLQASTYNKKNQHNQLH